MCEMILKLYVTEYYFRHGGLRRGDQILSIGGEVSLHNNVSFLCTNYLFLLQSLEDANHVNAVDLLKNTEGTYTCSSC